MELDNNTESILCPDAIKHTISTTIFRIRVAYGLSLCLAMVLAVIFIHFVERLSWVDTFYSLSTWLTFLYLGVLLIVACPRVLNFLYRKDSFPLHQCLEALYQTRDPSMIGCLAETLKYLSLLYGLPKNTLYTKIIELLPVLKTEE